MSENFINAPIYSVGDNFATRGDSSSSSGSGSEFRSYEYYQYSNSNAAEYYQIGEAAPGATVRNENFHYYADDTTGIVRDVSKYLELDVYDSSERKQSKNISSFFQYDWGEETRTESSTFTYVDSTSRKLLTNIESRESLYTSYDSDYNDYALENITFSYDYSGLRESDIFSEWDYSTRWGVGTRTFQNSDDVNETFDLFTKESRSDNNSSNSFEELRVEAIGQFIVKSHISSDQYSRNGSTYLNINSEDYDQDGIIDYKSEYTDRIKGDNRTSISVYKDDFDGDGQADYINMSRENESRSGSQRTEYYYSTQSSKKPILEIVKSRTDSSGNTQTISENSVFRTLTPKHTNMGDHVVELTDVLA